MLNNLDSRNGVLMGSAGPYGCFDAFLPSMGVFSVVPDPTPVITVQGVKYHVPDSNDTEGLTVTSNSFVHGTSIHSDVIVN